MASPAVVRMCLGCRERAATRELLRLVVRPDAQDQGSLVVVPDPKRTATGRGAHLHPTTACLALAERKRAFPRAFRLRTGTDTRLLHEYVGQLEQSV